MSFLRDIAYGVRTLRQNPWFTLTALLSLTIGVGSSTAIFAVVNAILLRPLPGIREPQRLVNVHLRGTGDAGFRSFSGPSLRDFQESDTAFSGLASFSDHAFSLARRGESQLVARQIVSGNYFEVLGVKPLRGRFFAPEERREGSGPAVAVVSFTLWQRR